MTTSTNEAIPEVSRVVATSKTSGVIVLYYAPRLPLRPYVSTAK